MVQTGSAAGPAYRADAHRLAQILNNFVGNALKFTASGTVTIRADLRVCTDGAAYLRFDVCDTGPGIPTDLQATLFDAFDIVLTDLNMPGMDGYALARALREDNARVPIVALTANALPADAERAHAAGVTRLLLKPLALDTLQELLQTLELAATAPAASAPVMGEVVQAQMWTAFLQTARQDLTAMRQALDGGDSVAMIDLLHSFAGALAFLGQREATQGCQIAEQALRTTDAMDAQTRTTVIKAIGMITASVETCERHS